MSTVGQDECSEVILMSWTMNKWALFERACRYLDWSGLDRLINRKPMQEETEQPSAVMIDAALLQAIVSEKSRPGSIQAKYDPEAANTAHAHDVTAAAASADSGSGRLAMALSHLHDIMPMAHTHMPGYVDENDDDDAHHLVDDDDVVVDASDQRRRIARIARAQYRPREADRPLRHVVDAMLRRDDLLGDVNDVDVDDDAEIDGDDVDDELDARDDDEDVRRLLDEVPFLMGYAGGIGVGGGLYAGLTAADIADIGAELDHDMSNQLNFDMRLEEVE